MFEYEIKIKNKWTSNNSKKSKLILLVNEIKNPKIEKLVIKKTLKNKPIYELEFDPENMDLLIKNYLPKTPSYYKNVNGSTLHKEFIKAFY